MTFLGLLALEDPPREEAAKAVRELRAAGVRIMMVTGDHPATAQAIARKVGIEATGAPLRGSQLDGLQGDAWEQAVRSTSIFARSTPQHKLRIVQTLQQQGEVVAVTGDGVNDAPALATADIGIAIGAGTDVAIETANIVLMKSDPLDIVNAIILSKATVRKMKQNLVWASVYNVLAIPIAAGAFYHWLGWSLRPEVSALLMSASSIVVAVNAVMLRRSEGNLINTRHEAAAQ